MTTIKSFLGEIIHPNTSGDKARRVALEQLLTHLGITEEHLDFLSSLYTLKNINGIWVYRVDIDTERKFENSGKKVSVPPETDLHIAANYAVNPSLSSSLYAELSQLPFSPIHPRTKLDGDFTELMETVKYLLPSNQGFAECRGSVTLTVYGAKFPHPHTGIAKATERDVAN